MKKKLTCIVHGRVQMVMFRDFVKRNARRLNLVGTVQNSPDGSVRVEVEGEEENLQKCLEILKHGSILSSVQHIEISWHEPDGNYSDFQIVY